MKAYQLKVMIKDSHPPIWRRIIVPSGLTFSQLTLILNTVMEWSGYHLSNYEFSSVRTMLDDDYEDDEDDFWGPWRRLDASIYLIDEFFDTEKRCVYTYDFGDNWEHVITIEKILEDYPQNYAQVIKYKGNSPAEDCGGIEAYSEILRDSADMQECDYCVDDINLMLEQMPLLNKKSKPMTRTELYNRYFKGENSFLRAKIPENREEDRYSQENYVPGLVENPDEYMRMALQACEVLVRTEIILKIQKNTDLTEKQIFKALEMTKDDISNHREAIKFIKNDMQELHIKE